MGWVGYPLVITRVVLENLPFSSLIFPLKPPFSSEVFQPATFDVTGGYPLVNIQKTMENHNFEWVNQL